MSLRKEAKEMSVLSDARETKAEKSVKRNISIASTFSLQTGFYPRYSTKKLLLKFQIIIVLNLIDTLQSFLK